MFMRIYIYTYIYIYIHICTYVYTCVTDCDLDELAVGGGVGADGVVDEVECVAFGEQVGHQRAFGPIPSWKQRGLFIDNLLVRIHWTWWTGLAPWRPAVLESRSAIRGPSGQSRPGNKYLSKRFSSNKIHSTDALVSLVLSNRAVNCALPSDSRSAIRGPSGQSRPGGKE